MRDLFFDTGMGSHAYSVIERQMVDHVLSDNSGHRRFLFEEASGITKYKARKKEALAKLDATEGDLTRLGDIVYEIEREIRSLARQVGKARRFQRLRDSIRDLDLRLTSGRVRTLREKEGVAAERWQEEAVRREGVTAALDALEAKLNDQKLQLLELERELMTAQGGLRDREETRAQAQQQVVLLRERASGLSRRANEAADEAARMRERLAEVSESEREALEKRAELRRDREASQIDAESAERDLNAAEAELRQRRTVAAERKQLSLDLFSVEAEKRGACERVRERQAFLGERREELARRASEMEAKLAELGNTLEMGAGQRTSLEGELEAARSALAASEQAIAAVASELHDLEASLGGVRRDSAAAESRLDTLLELKRNYEGVSEGARALFNTAERPAGLLGLVADVLEIPSRYLDALEASLGEAAAFVLVADGAALEAALGRLRGVESGRATLVDLSTVSIGAPRALPEDPAVLGRASELVHCEERYRPLVDRLLGTVVMVEDRATASRLAADATGLRFVSLDGEVWERGRVRAGSSRNLRGLLHRESEIRELSGQIADLGLTIEGMEREVESAERRRGEGIERRTAAAAELDARRAALETLARDLDAAERERRWATSGRDDRRREIGVIEVEIEALTRAAAEAATELETFQAELDQARTQLADLDGAVHALEQRRDETSARAQESRERLLRLSREEGEWEAKWARAEQTRRELEVGIEARTGEHRQSMMAVAEIEAEVNGLEAGLTGLLDSESSQRERVTELQGKFQALKVEVQAGEDDARARRFEQIELAELLHQIELDKLQTHSELDLTFERLKTEYGMDPEGWTPENADAEFDVVAAEAGLESSRERLRGLGAVNLLALDEYTKKKERYDFLIQQRADLQSARAQLLEAIEKINVTASQLFVDTFEKVQVHFRDIFKTLFEGGDAELRTMGEDPLECEIEIAAKPRGKHLQSISLMSGGERALTAIALLFAIYLVKPSPFCLLDEVDAPLDDANVDRFIKMLQRFSGKTQFVVITHNKKTMESAACLYGVTMQELGVSTLVSVKFDRPSAEAAPPVPIERELEEPASV